MFFLLQILPYCKKVTTYLICSLLRNYVTTCPFCLKYSVELLKEFKTNYSKINRDVNADIFVGVHHRAFL